MRGSGRDGLPGKCTITGSATGPPDVDDLVLVLGIDCSLTAPALSFYEPTTGWHLTTMYKPRAKGSARLSELYDFVFYSVEDQLRENGDIGAICMEGYSFASKSRGHAIGEGGGVVRLALWHLLGREPTDVAPSQVKKFALGTGAGDKNLVLKRVFQKWGVDFPNDNLADAYTLARVAAAVASGETEHKYEQDVIAKILASSS